MVNIWKIGAWPGLWGENSTENRGRYISEYALPYGFVAIGYGWVPDLSILTKEKIRDYLKEEYEKRDRNPNISRKTNEIYNFANGIKENDIMLLYTRYTAHVGTVLKRPDTKRPYYFVKKGSDKDFIADADGENIAPHRIGVRWEFNKRLFDNIDFSMWRDTVHRVLEKDLEKVRNPKLCAHLKQKIDP